jgi:hypothetical protein
MSTSGIILFIAFLIGAGAFILWPIFRRGTTPKSDPVLDVTDQVLSPLVTLQAEREGVLLALRDLDFDYQTGKFTEADYRNQRELLVQRGVALLKQIDATRSDAIDAAARARRG